MRLRFATAIVLMVLTTTLVGAQKSKPKTKPKPKPIKATVTIKADPPVKPLPKETDADVWQEFTLKDDDLKLLFPGSKEDISDDSYGPVRTFQVSTEKASYMLAIREVGSSLVSGTNDEYLEQAIERFVDDQTRLIEKKNIIYQGYSGKQIVSDAQGKRLAARLHLLNNKLFIMMVTVKSGDYHRDFDKWIEKFFDSFQVRVPVREA